MARSAKDEAEAEAIRQALDQTNWNRKQAAVLLQISYKALLYKIRQYGIAEAKSTQAFGRRVAGCRMWDGHSCPSLLTLPLKWRPIHS